MGRTIEKIKRNYPEVVFLSIDVNDHPEIAEKFKIESIPASYLYASGKEASTMDHKKSSKMKVGQMSEEELLKFLK
jgi:thioredoxin-like negative regulator of GroEL